MKFASPEMERRYSLLVEGQCPCGHGELERHYGWGRCRDCGVDWRCRGNVIEAKVADIRWERHNSPDAQQRPDP